MQKQEASAISAGNMQQVSSMGKMQLMPSTHASVHATSVKLIGSKHVGSGWLEHLIQNFKPTPKTREEIHIKQVICRSCQILMKQIEWLMS